MEGRYNLKSPAVKRLMKEAQELKDPTSQYFAQPLEDNLFEWHFTVRGPPDSDFHGGIYHGRIILPPDYPMKPPSIILLTPNGRFELSKKICLSISGHHPESWQPSWSIRTALLAIIGFMPTHGHGAIGSLDYTPDERRTLARKSADWRCPQCGVRNEELLLAPDEESASARSDRLEAQKLAGEIAFQGEAEKKAGSSSGEGGAPAEASGDAGQTTTETTDEDKDDSTLHDVTTGVTRNDASFTDALTGVRHHRRDDAATDLDNIRRRLHLHAHGEASTSTTSQGGPSTPAPIPSVSPTTSRALSKTQSAGQRVPPPAAPRAVTVERSGRDRQQFSAGLICLVTVLCSALVLLIARRLLIIFERI